MRISRLLQVSIAALLLAVPALSQGYPGSWVGQFIWDAGEPVPYHYFLMARGQVDLDSAPKAAKLQITAADRYMLYVNGAYIGRGPARGDARWTSFDTYDVAGRLRAGRNTVAVLAYHYGARNGYTRDSRAGLFVQVETTAAGGARRVTGSSGEWRVRPAKGWNRTVEQINPFVGMLEVYDANQDPPNWTAADFDDSGWERAYVIPWRMSPWSYLEARQTPMMREREVFPARVVQTGEVRELPPRTLTDVQVPQRLAAEPHIPFELTRVQDAEAVLKSDGRPAIFTAMPYQRGGDYEKGGRAPYMIVDFGRPLFGFPKVRLRGPAQAVFEMTYGPQLIDGRVPPIMTNQRYGDRYVLRGGEQTWQTFEYRQFRYLQLVVRGTSSPVAIDSVSLVSYEYPAEPAGSFECSNPALNRLWKAGVDTAYLQMEDAVLCDATRERMVYICDGSHGIYPIYAAFGDLPIVDRMFRLISRGAMPDGLLRTFYPGFDNAVGQPVRPRDITSAENTETIVQFSLMFPMFLAEHYRLYGRRDLVEEMYPTLTGVARWYDRQKNADGLVYNLGNWNWLDHVQTEMRGANLETNALYCNMLEDSAMLAAATGHDADSAGWRRQAETVRQAIRRLHWNPQRGMYADSVIDGKQVSTITELSNGMMLLFGIATPAQTPQIVKGMLDPQNDIVRATPLFYYYALEGLIRAGAIVPAMADMSARYEGMLRASDFPTIWESWKDASSSQVHTGGTGPTWTLSKHLLGVHPVEPGFQKCRIEPETAGLEWARGVFPSPRGNVKVDWKRTKGAFTLGVSLPAALETEIVMERSAGADLTLTHNGARYAIPAGASSVAGIGVSDRRLSIHVTGGEHRLELSSGSR